MAVIVETSTGKSMLLDDEEKKKKRVHPEREDPNDVTKYVSYRPRHHERARIRLTEKEIEDRRKLYSQVVVHDFGDSYHMSEEEREKNNQWYRLSRELSQVKSQYKRLDKFILAYRKVLSVVKIIAEKNIVMSSDKFVKKVIAGDIRINGVKFPKLLMPKKKRKEMNWDLITQYIVNEKLDPMELMRPETPSVDWDTVVTNPKEEMKRLFGMSYEKYVKNVPTTPTVVDFDDPDSLEGKNVIVPMNQLELIRFIKENKSLGPAMKDAILKFRKFSKMERQMRGDDYDDYHQSVFLTKYDDIEIIRDMDEERNLLRKAKKSDKFEFSGDFTNDDNVNQFVYESDEYLSKKLKVRMKGSYADSVMTLSEMEEEELRELLEAKQWNIRSLYGIRQEEQNVKKKVKKEQKRLKKIKEALIKSEKKDGKKTSMVGFKVTAKKDNGVNSKKKKKSKKQEKKYKKDKRRIEMLLLEQSARKDYAEYENSMLNFDD